ncbi:nuclear transport factor 2 family protein [Runella aurantiaca]|uniref:Nuclear transport factor 2 family protein n=1 Tax=Runella aurantiaca TaxID=2282308 RepID=A0A369HYZ8_9BACT|nr:nuclear transport factor 2 family protein [Runella aurantiaca]RDB02761.1 nuclear transport factor 2 family protein [Runella aurantiaca]
MKNRTVPFLLLRAMSAINLNAQPSGFLLSDAIPANFVHHYYEAYCGMPTAEKLSTFYADEAVIYDPTYDWVGKSKVDIFRNFDANNSKNENEWHIHQEIRQGNTLVTEGLLKAKYGGIAYEMRFVNIFHFEKGLIIK